MEPKAPISIDVDKEQDFVRALKWCMYLAYKINEERGWHDPAPSDGEAALMVHSEVAEITEYLRGKPLTDRDDKLPEFLGVEAEGADVLIRMFSWYRRRGWRLPEATMAKLRFNSTRPYRHGGKAL